MNFIDIGANLLADHFQGVYYDKKKHESDLNAVLERAWEAGVTKIIITAGTLQETKDALALCKTDNRLFTTVGVHPTRTKQVFEGLSEEEVTAYIDEMIAIAKENPKKIVAVGEFGLDYDRLEFSPKDTQIKFLKLQLHVCGGGVCEETHLPLFLHNRASSDDLADILKEASTALSAGGVVHSFDDPPECAVKFVELGLCIGLNGCSLRGEDGLQTAATVPLTKLMLETDAPWCSIKNTHPGAKMIKTTWPTKKKPDKWEAGFCIKDRCEPCHIVQVCEVIAGQRNIQPAEVAEVCFEVTEKVFFKD